MCPSFEGLFLNQAVVREKFQVIVHACNLHKWAMNTAKGFQSWKRLHSNGHKTDHSEEQKRVLMRKEMKGPRGKTVAWWELYERGRWFCLHKVKSELEMFVYFAKMNKWWWRLWKRHCLNIIKMVTRYLIFCYVSEIIVGFYILSS